MQKRVLVFGTFDGIHSGHDFFLRSAKTRGTELIVGVARDKHVVELKAKKPLNNEIKRLKAILELPSVDEAQLCDEVLGTFNIIKSVSPELIVLGHDQNELEKALLAWMNEHDHYVPMIRIKKIPQH